MCPPWNRVHKKIDHTYRKIGQIWKTYPLLQGGPKIALFLYALPLSNNYNNWFDDALKPATPLSNGVISETLRQFAISQGSVATYLSCGEIFSDGIGPILWGHSGPLCHALSSLSSLSLLWTSMRRRRATVATPGEWQCGVRRLAVANGPNIFQMLLVINFSLFWKWQFQKSVNIW